MLDRGTVAIVPAVAGDGLARAQRDLGQVHLEHFDDPHPRAVAHPRDHRRVGAGKGRLDVGQGRPVPGRRADELELSVDDGDLVDLVDRTAPEHPLPIGVQGRLQQGEVDQAGGLVLRAAELGGRGRGGQRRGILLPGPVVDLRPGRIGEWGVVGGRGSREGCALE